MKHAEASEVNSAGNFFANHRSIAASHIADCCSCVRSPACARTETFGIAPIGEMFAFTVRQSLRHSETRHVLLDQGWSAMGQPHANDRYLPQTEVQIDFPTRGAGIFEPRCCDRRATQQQRENLSNWLRRVKAAGHTARTACQAAGKT